MAINLTAISAIAANSGAERTLRTPGSAASGTGGFGALLSNAVHYMDQQQKTADNAVENLLTGEQGELHNVALATQQAEMTFELGLQLRNKVVQTYQEIMRMQI